jgi:hypothetical protein
MISIFEKHSKTHFSTIWAFRKTQKTHFSPAPPLLFSKSGDDLGF